MKFSLLILINIHRSLVKRYVNAGNAELAELNEAQLQVYQGVLSEFEAAVARSGSEAAAAAHAVSRLQAIDARIASNGR